MSAGQLHADAVQPGHDDAQTIEAYRGNILIDACGPILSPKQLLKAFMELPKEPIPGSGVPAYLLEHELAAIFRLHVPTEAGLDIAATIDVMIRQGYMHRRPSSASTWRRIMLGQNAAPSETPLQLAGVVGGLSGVGKSNAIERALRLKSQVVIHEAFPGLVGPVKQMIWLKVDVPESGRVGDLAEMLCLATDQILGTAYRKDVFSGRSRPAPALAREWLAKVACHFPGIVVLDEIQNLFKIETKAVRQVARSRHDARPPLRIKDDETLKLVLTMTNTSKIPFLGAGTPDGIEAFTSRMSTSQRLSTAGFYQIPHAETPDDAYFRKTFFPILLRYQWLPRKLEASDDLRRLVHQLSGGIARICAALWIHAQRRALKRGADILATEDLIYASEYPMKLVRPAVQALLSQDPSRMALYEDLLPRGLLK